MEQAGCLTQARGLEEFGNGQKATFSEQRLELADDREESDEVNGSHATLDEGAGEDEVAEVVVERGHNSSSMRLDEAGSD